jgi:hypothetical protein
MAPKKPKERWVHGGKRGLRMIRRKRHLRFKPTERDEERMVAQAKETYDQLKMGAEALAKKVVAKFLSAVNPTDDTMKERAVEYFDKQLATRKRRRQDEDTTTEVASEYFGKKLPTLKRRQDNV